MQLPLPRTALALTTLAVLSLAGTPPYAQAPLDFAIVQIRNSLGALRNTAGEVPVDALRAQLVANFYANNFDPDPAITPHDQLIARQLPNARERANRLARFHRADLDGDGQVTATEAQAQSANAFWREYPSGTGQHPTGTGTPQMTFDNILARNRADFPLDRATLLSPEWKTVSTLSIPPGLDTDGDQRIEPEEYTRTLDAALALADLDRDGLLSEGEITALVVRSTASDTLIATAPPDVLFWLE